MPLTITNDQPSLSPSDMSKNVPFGAHLDMPLVMPSNKPSLSPSDMTSNVPSDAHLDMPSVMLSYQPNMSPMLMVQDSVTTRCVSIVAMIDFNDLILANESIFYLLL